jgi:THO complex subunit 3
VQTNQIAFCWSGKKIFVTTSEGQIRILSYPEFQPVLRMGEGDDAPEFTLKGHTAACLTAELQPTGRYLATGGANSIIALWDTTDWLCHRTVTRMTGPVRSISEFFLFNTARLRDLVVSSEPFHKLGSRLTTSLLCRLHIRWQLRRRR